VVARVGKTFGVVGTGPHSDLVNKVLTFFEEEVLKKGSVSARFDAITKFQQIFADYDKIRTADSLARDVGTLLKIFETLVTANPWFNDFPFVMWFHFKIYS